MTENQLRQKVADIINAWVGATRGSAKHLEILEIYNSHKPLARGYKMQVKDAYCAATVSAAYIKAGIAEYTGTECGVEKFVQIAKGKGVWVENDAHICHVGGACVYDWDDTGKGDCTGAGDHIGIVTQVNSAAGTFVVTEGNMSSARWASEPWPSMESTSAALSARTSPPLPRSWAGPPGGRPRRAAPPFTR